MDEIEIEKDNPAGVVPLSDDTLAEVEGGVVPNTVYYSCATATISPVYC
jgi:hypothetical protein